MKGQTALKWIVTEAKDIQEKHPAKKWSSCIKEAGVAYRKKFGSTAAKAKAGRKGGKKRAAKAKAKK